MHIQRFQEIFLAETAWYNIQWYILAILLCNQLRRWFCSYREFIRDLKPDKYDNVNEKKHTRAVVLNGDSILNNLCVGGILKEQ